MRNFIQRNIDNVKGSKRVFSLAERDNTTKSPPKLNNRLKPDMNSRIKDLQTQISNLQSINHQQLIIEQLASIKQDIRMIKSHIYQVSREKAHGRSPNYESNKLKTHSSNPDQEQNIYTLQINTRMKTHSENEQNKHVKKMYKLDEILNNKSKKSTSSYNKNSISLKSINPLLKDYKLEGPEHGNIFYGYSKRNSQAVAIKYSQESLNSVIEVYDKLWKNIAKAKNPCINRIYDYKSDDINVIVMEKNKTNIVGLPQLNVLIDILRILQFIHECGYLYRNIQPEHFMVNEDGQLVVIDFKRARRYVDVKGHNMDVIQTNFNGSPFASNNQVRCLLEGRKDDLQSLGYLALLLLEMQIPWLGMNKQQTIRVRSNLTLQQLYHHNYKWVEYMAVVMKISRNEKPDYRKLYEILSS